MRGLYVIAALATAIGIAVVVILNMATPVEYILDQLVARDQGQVLHWGRLLGRRLFGLLFMVGLSCLPLVFAMRQILRPISSHLTRIEDGQRPGDDSLEDARRRLVNLPFIMVPVNIVLWILLPAVLFYAAYATGRLDATTSLTLAIRSCMVGLISAAIASFWVESYARHQLIPFFFPQGRLTDVEGIARLSISKRIRLSHRLGGVTPMAILVVTVWTLQWQVTATVASARDQVHGILVFSLVLFGVFFVGSSVLNRLISRSIAGPVGDLLDAIARVRSGDLQTHVRVVSTDEIGILGDATNEMIQGLAERQLLSDTFGRYVSPEVRDEILSGRIPLDGELKDVTVMFADLRDFTPLTESNDPKLVVSMLNGYFGEMAAAIQKHGGLILQFLGDEIYAVFGAPIRQSDHPTRAVKAALSMSRRLTDLNRRFSEKGWPTLRHGIGIHTGDVLAANIGSPDRLSYLLVGDTVNLASRLQAATRDVESEIILSAATHARLIEGELDAHTLRQLPPMSVKGKKLPVEILTLS